MNKKCFEKNDCLTLIRVYFWIQVTMSTLFTMKVTTEYNWTIVIKVCSKQSVRNGDSYQKNSEYMMRPSNTRTMIPIIILSCDGQKRIREQTLVNQQGNQGWKTWKRYFIVNKEREQGKLQWPDMTIDLIRTTDPFVWASKRIIKRLRALRGQLWHLAKRNDCYSEWIASTGFAIRKT